MLKSLVIDGMYEIFHPDVPYGLSDRFIARALGRDSGEIERLDAKTKASLVRSNPKPILDGLLEHEDRPSLFKVFPGHLDRTQTRRHILLNPAITKVVVDRSPLDVHISGLKADLVSKWRNVDTTDIKISLDRDRFESWFAGRKDWYDFYYDTLSRSGQRFGYINYIDIESRGTAQLVDYFVNLMAGLGCELTRSDNVVQGLMKKQDKSRSPAEKVDNWDEFQRTFPRGEIDEKYTSGFLNLPTVVR